jgi:hypothetical protein
VSSKAKLVLFRWQTKKQHLFLALCYIASLV